MKKAVSTVMALVMAITLAFIGPGAVASPARAGDCFVVAYEPERTGTFSVAYGGIAYCPKYEHSGRSQTLHVHLRQSRWGTDRTVAHGGYWNVPASGSYIRYSASSCTSIRDRAETRNPKLYAKFYSVSDDGTTNDVDSSLVISDLCRQ